MERIITLNGSVDEGNCLSVILQLLYLDSQGHDPIYLYINSEGGSISNGLAVYDTIHLIKSPVYTICMGLAASMGAFLLSCGKKGFRGALPHSRILIHQPLIYTRYGSADTATGMERMAESITRTRKELETIIADNVGKSYERVHEDCERDNWMSAEEALKYGLIDHIIDKL